MIDVHKRQGQSQQCFEHRVVFIGVSKSTWFCIGYAQTLQNGFLELVI